MELKGNYIIQRTIKKISFFIEGFELKESIYYRTTGLKDKIGYELEYALPMHPREAIRLTDCILPQLLNGFKIENKYVTSELTGAPVMLLITEPKYKYYDDEKILRIIFSDENFKLPNELNCHPIYAKQL